VLVALLFADGHVDDDDDDVDVVQISIPSTQWLFVSERLPGAISGYYFVYVPHIMHALRSTWIALIRLVPAVLVQQMSMAKRRSACQSGPEMLIGMVLRAIPALRMPWITHWSCNMQCTNW
jgi:hypothetical protein